jgi:uncharacterized protein with NAD-binding domain and iron-sulfur cluster
LSTLLVDPAVKFVANHGGQVRTGTRVHAMTIRDDRVVSVHTASGELIEAASFIQAVPYFDLPMMLPDDLIVPSVPLFVSTPIVSINLWFDHEVFAKEFAAVLNSNIQWIFNRTRMCRREQTADLKSQHLSLVISGAEDYVDFDKESIVQIALNDLRRVVPAVNGAKLLHSLVVKEKRATFSPRPGLELVRPDTKTKVRNLFLAGDWTNTGYPATIEGAVMSGKKAAEAVISGLPAGTKGVQAGQQ